jgi:hypothetical protein
MFIQRVNITGSGTVGFLVLSGEMLLGTLTMFVMGLVTTIGAMRLLFGQALWHKTG